MSWFGITLHLLAGDNSLCDLFNAQATYLQYGMGVQRLKYCLGVLSWSYGEGRGSKADRMRQALDNPMAGSRAFGLQQTQIAGAGYSFSPTLNLQFAKELLIVALDRTQGQEQSLANLTIRESLGDKL